MAVQALARRGEDRGAVAGAYRRQERRHQRLVTATVPAAGGAVARGAGVDRVGAAGEEVGDGEAVAVALDRAAGAEDPGLPVRGGGEGGHGERGGAAALELQVHHLVVDHIVVAGVHAPAVRAGPERFEDAALGEVVGDHVQRPGILARQRQVDALGRVGAGVLDGAVQAAVGRALGPVLRPEVLEAAERRHLGDLPAGEVDEPVEVVAGLGEQHERRLVGPAPVAPYVRVRLVPPADRLQVLDADDLADPAGVEQRLQRAGIRRVAQHVADREDRVRALGSGHDRPAVVLGDGHRLLQQDVVAQLGEAHRGLDMIGVLRRDDHGVRLPGERRCKQLPYVGRR